MNRILLFIVLAATALFIAGGPAPAAPASSSDDVKAVAAGNNAFTADLYGKLVKADENLFFSPYSISSALAMTYLGARGATADEMARTLHFTLRPGSLHPAYGALIRRLNSGGAGGSFDLFVANRLWGQKGEKLLPVFLDDEEKYYGSKLVELDFRHNLEKSRITINTWVEQQTKDKIKELLARGTLLPDTPLVLTNAIYFKSAWAEAFDKKATRKEPFHVGKDKKVDVDMMHKVIQCRYGSMQDVALLEMPYTRHALSMIVLLPLDIEGIRKLEASLTPDALGRMLAKLGDGDSTPFQPVEVSLPKFKTTGTFDLAATLQGMGMKSAFGRGADFSGIDGGHSLFISKVIHKAFVDVDEQGTEAAAATAVVMARGCAPVKDKAITFRADHPFIFLIRHNESGAILFMGRFARP
jgi:serine protease inhibitor